MRAIVVVILTAVLASASWGQVAGRAPTRGATQPATRPGTPLATRGATLPATQPGLRTFDTPYYTLHTDVTDQEARETDLRLTRIFEEYQRRTAGFAGAVKGQAPERRPQR